MKTNATARWKLVSLVSVVCMVPTLLMSIACIGRECEEDPGPPAANCAVEANGTIIRTLEVFDAAREWEDAGVPRSPLRSGGTIGRVLGGQGSDMVTTRVRMDAAMDTEADGTERCMEVTYAGMSMRYTSSLRFVREGDYWILDRVLLDPLDGGGTFTQTISVRDEMLTGTSTLSLTVE